MLKIRISLFSSWPGWPEKASGPLLIPNFDNRWCWNYR